jgi:hypothetical protein
MVSSYSFQIEKSLAEHYKMLIMAYLEEGEGVIHLRARKPHSKELDVLIGVYAVLPIQADLYLQSLGSVPYPEETRLR